MRTLVRNAKYSAHIANRHPSVRELTRGVPPHLTRSFVEFSGLLGKLLGGAEFFGKLGR